MAAVPRGDSCQVVLVDSSIPLDPHEFQGRRWRGRGAFRRTDPKELLFVRQCLQAGWNRAFRSGNSSNEMVILGCPCQIRRRWTVIVLKLMAVWCTVSAEEHLFFCIISSCYSNASKRFRDTLSSMLRNKSKGILFSF